MPVTACASRKCGKVRGDRMEIRQPKRTSPRYPVLLVDDEESWLRSFQGALRASGVDNVVTLTDSRQVLDTLARQPHCAVAVDLM